MDTNTDAKVSPRETIADGKVAPMQAKIEDTEPETLTSKTPQDPCINQNLIDGVSKVLEQWASQHSSQVTSFHSVQAPSMSLGKYVDRLRSYFFCSDACFLAAFIYIDRIIKRHSHIQVCSLSGHRLFAVSLIMAVKYNEDTYYSNAYYAKVAGLRLQEVNKLERHFLRLLDWKLIVQPEEYSMYCELFTAAVGTESTK